MTERSTFVYEIDTGVALSRVELEIDSAHGLVISTDSSNEDKSWTDLSYRQCKNCRLATQKKCPIAEGISQLSDDLVSLASFDEIKVVVHLDDNIHVSAETTAQQLLSSLIGIIVAASSDCEHTQFLWPMVRYHRPFASHDESIYRAMANAALYFTLDSTQSSFEQYLADKYEQLRMVNTGLVERLRDSSGQYESIINGLVNLNTFVQGILFNAKNDFIDLKEQGFE